MALTADQFVELLRLHHTLHAKRLRDSMQLIQVETLRLR